VGRGFRHANRALIVTGHDQPAKRDRRREAHLASIPASLISTLELPASGIADSVRLVIS
jgi:hypothetical protein